MTISEPLECKFLDKHLGDVSNNNQKAFTVKDSLNMKQYKQVTLLVDVLCLFSSNMTKT